MYALNSGAEVFEKAVKIPKFFVEYKEWWANASKSKRGAFDASGFEFPVSQGIITVCSLLN